MKSLVVEVVGDCEGGKQGSLAHSHCSAKEAPPLPSSMLLGWSLGLTASPFLHVPNESHHGQV